VNTVHNKLRAVVVGAGTGGMLSIRALDESERFDLVGVADLSAESRARVESSFSGVETSADYRDLFASTRPDVVCVSTWAPSHAEVTEAALEAGVRGLLVEKPLGDTVAAGRRVLAATRAAQVPFVVPHGLMAQAAPLDILRRVEEGQLGRVLVVEIESAHWDIINAGIHWIQFFALLATPAQVVSVLTACDTGSRTFRDGMQVETESITVATTDRGVRLLLHTGDDIPLARPGTECVIRVVGSDGTIEYGAWDDHFTLLTATSGRVEIEPRPLSSSGHRFHLDHLADLVERHETDERIPLASLSALEVVEAAYRSQRLRSLVTLPLTEPEPEPSSTDWDPGRPYAGVGGGRDGRAL
jgi:predicted dehydrogenase